MKYSHNQLRDLIELLRDGKVGEFEYEDEEIRLRFNFAVGASPTTTLAGPPTSQAIAAPAPTGRAAPTDVAFITSPFVGTFYRASSPDTAPYVQLGQTISKGQTLCIVEAMKLMNEIESDIEGTLLEILVENGANVEFGQRLFKIRKNQVA